MHERKSDEPPSSAMSTSTTSRRHYSEALHESNYPAVRLEFSGAIRSAEVDDARKFWAAYSAAVAAIKKAVLNRPSAQADESKPADRIACRSSTR